jgi:hypothetical protein
MDAASAFHRAGESHSGRLHACRLPNTAGRIGHARLGARRPGHGRAIVYRPRGGGECEARYHDGWQDVARLPAGGCVRCPTRKLLAARAVRRRLGMLGAVDSDNLICQARTRNGHAAGGRPGCRYGNPGLNDCRAAETNGTVSPTLRFRRFTLGSPFFPRRSLRPLRLQRSTSGNLAS